MAEVGERGPGRMAEPHGDPRRHRGRRSPPGTALNGAPRHSSPPAPPTSPSIPVRYIANRSSGQPGLAPSPPRSAPPRRPTSTLRHRPRTASAPPAREGAAVVAVETAREMLAAALKPRSPPMPPSAPPPSPTGASTAAGGSEGQEGPTSGTLARPRARREPRHPARTERTPTPTARASSSASPPRPTTVLANATGQAHRRKGCRLDRRQRRLALDRHHGRHRERGDADHDAGAEPWPRMSKAATAEALAERIAKALHDDRRRPPAAEPRPPCPCRPTPPGAAGMDLRPTSRRGPRPRPTSPRPPARSSRPASPSRSRPATRSRSAALGLALRQA